MFKVGDWVTSLSGETKQITGFSEEQASTIIHSDGFMCYASDCETWQPQEGEWVIPSKAPAYDWSTFTVTKYSNTLGKCEPFIGKLPSFIKENK